MGMSSKRDWRSIEKHVEAIIEGRAQERPDGVAELPRITGRLIVVERLAALPPGVERHVAQRRQDRLEGIVAQIAFALARQLGQLLYGGKRRHEPGRKHVKMQLHIDSAAAGRDLGRRDADDMVVAPVKW